MKVDNFLSHHGLTENPFAAEEARLDAVFARLSESGMHHPDFDKIMGDIGPAGDRGGLRRKGRRAKPRFA